MLTKFADDATLVVAVDKTGHDLSEIALKL